MTHQSLNNGILTRKRKVIAPQQRKTRRGMPVSHAVMLVVGLCAMSSSYAYSIRPEPVETIRYRERPVVIEYQTIKHETFPVPVCGQLPIREMQRSKTSWGRRQVDLLAAALPASALRSVPTSN